MNKFFRVSVSIASLFAAATAFAFPDRPITLVIPFPPAGTADTVARPLATELSNRLKVPVILEYKPGAGSSIGTQYVARANPDGYTLLMVLASHAINPSLYPKLPFDAVKDFAPISLVARLPLVLYTNPGFPASTVPELIAYAKKNPGKVNIASAGNGLTTHLATVLFSAAAGINTQHIPYKGGGPSITAAMGGEVQAVFAGPDSYKFAQAGKLKMIAVAGKDRWPFAPEVPAISETLKNFEVNGWYGIVAPAKTPSSIIRRLNEEIGAVLKDPAFQKLVGPLGYTLTPSSPIEFEAFINSEMKRWGDVIKKGDIKID